MATLLKSKSFQKNLFLSVGGIFLIFSICFSLYQYKREKAFKIDILHSRMQMLNLEIEKNLGHELYKKQYEFNNYVKSSEIEGLRITVIDTNGNVLIDSNLDKDKMMNHRYREEIIQALKNGNGYDIKRASESESQTYFYSATRFDDIIIRAAIPYSAKLTKSLKADNSYIYFAVIMTILMSMVLYKNTSRIGNHIEYLREFAIRAKEGKVIENFKIPDDELGEISRTITELYYKLKHSEEEKTRIKKQLTQNAAHELKTPASSIQGYLETILNNPQINEEQRKHFLERCFAQSQRMTKLLLDMSTLTKLDEISENNNNVKFIKVDICTIIHNVFDDTALQLDEKKIEVILNLPKEIITLGDPNLLYSIFRNLTDNTIAYATGATHIYLMCEIEKKNGKEYYGFTFSDNGQGVENEHLPHLFERFYRVDKGRSRKMGGTGLGMAIVKNAVLAHGGDILAEKTLNGGLTIKFSIEKRNS